VHEFRADGAAINPPRFIRALALGEVTLGDWWQIVRRELVAGLALLWVFLFVPFLSPLRSTMFSIWLAYSIVWLAYGMRLISGTLLQVAPELEEAARVSGANDLRVKRDVTIPLIKYGMLASWLLIFLIFVRGSRQRLQAVREGRSIADAMELYGLTTPVCARMLRVGERSGNMGEMMERIAGFYDEELSRWVGLVTRLIEPALMSLIGVVIGVIVVLMYFPIFELAGSIK